MNTPGLETGHALHAGRDTRGWFVGDLIAWATNQGAALPGRVVAAADLALQVKWSDHPPGDARTEVAPGMRSIRWSILIDGDLTTEFEHVSGERTTITLSQRGEYVTWHGPSYRIGGGARGERRS